MKLSTRMAVVKVLDFRRSSVSQKSPTHKSWGVNKSCELRYANFSKGSNKMGTTGIHSLSSSYQIPEVNFPNATSIDRNALIY